MEFGYPSFHASFVNKVKGFNRPILPAVMAKNKDWKVEDIEKAFNLFTKTYSNSCCLIIPKVYHDRQSRYLDQSKFDVIEPMKSTYTADDLNTKNFKLDINKCGGSRAEVVLFLTTLIVFGEILPQFKVGLTRGVKDNGVDVVVFKDKEMKQILLGLDSKHGVHAKGFEKNQSDYEDLSDDMIMLGIYFQKQFSYDEQFISKDMNGVSIGKLTYEEYIRCLLAYIAKTQKKHNNSSKIYEQLNLLADIINGLA